MRQLTPTIGKRVKQLREGAGRRQEDLVGAAQACGIGWKRSTVAMFELGRYELKAAELLLLPRILHLAGVADLSLREVLTGDEDEVLVTDACRIRASELGKLLGLQAASKVRWSTSLHENPSEGSAQPLATDDLKLASTGLVMSSGQRVNAFMRGMTGEAEAKAARKFGVDLADLVNSAVDLWGRSLSDERDRRVDHAVEEDGLDVTPRTVQALRAHTTRALLIELAGELAVDGEN